MHSGDAEFLRNCDSLFLDSDDEEPDEEPQPQACRSSSRSCSDELKRNCDALFDSSSDDENLGKVELEKPPASSEYDEELGEVEEPSASELEPLSCCCFVTTDEKRDVDCEKSSTGDERKSVSFGAEAFVPELLRDLSDCSSCESVRQATSINYKDSDASLTRRMLNSVNAFGAVDNICEKGCSRKCYSSLLYESVKDLRVSFWGAEPTASERRDKIMTVLQEARSNFDNAFMLGKISQGDMLNYPNRLLFRCGHVEVCEKAFANILGMATLQGYKSKTWQSVVKSFTNPRSSNVKREKSKALRLRSGPRDHAYSYIQRIVDSEIVDRSAFRGHDRSIYIPYSKVSFFYDEYDYFCNTNQCPERASESTFRRAYDDLVSNMKKEKDITIKLSGGKGSFAKCDICHNADQLLHRADHWSASQLDIIRAYRRAHIQQQFHERIQLQTNIASTYELDHNGQPVTALLFGDGMTVYTGNTPRHKVKGRSSKAAIHHITSRVIGVEVHCGPVHGTLLYYTDDLARGGSNAIIEVTRQALLDLQYLLQQRHDKSGNALDLPRALILQFDNCTENKNKFTFTYFAMLVEANLFDRIDIFFLIVGHTHASIDQYFSVLGNLIHASNFIGSPLALESLLRGMDPKVNLSGDSWSAPWEEAVGVESDHDGSDQSSEEESKKTKKTKPLLVRKLSVIFDVKAALKPLINNKIKYYSIPHRFKLCKIFGVTAMQYSMYSGQDLLPRPPDSVSSEYDVVDESLDISFNYLDLVGGEDRFMKECGITTTDNSSILSDACKNNMRRMKILCDMSRDLEMLERTYIESEINETLKTELQSDAKEMQASVAAHQAHLSGNMTTNVLKHNTSKRGLICWLKPNVNRRIDPEPIHLKEVYSYLCAHEDYDSTGYDVFDLFDMEIGTQYDRIMKLIRSNESPKVVSTKKLCVSSFESLKKYCRQKGIESKADYSRLVESMKSIISTANEVLFQVKSNKVSTSTSRKFNYINYTLSRDEVVFYFHRATERGVCLVLLKEFERVLFTGMSYSILPLVRPTESNPEIKRKLKEDGERRMGAFNRVADGLLVRTASRVLPGQEALARDALNEMTTDCTGEKPLFRNLTEDRDTLDNFINFGSKKRKRATEIHARTQLNGLKLGQLKELASSENISMPDGVRLTKQMYIEAIEAARRGQP